MKYVVGIDGRTFVVELDGASARVDGGEPMLAHIEDVEHTPVRLVSVGQTLHRVVARRDGARGSYVFSMDGRRFHVDALDERARTIRDMADASRPPAGPVPLLAPMPGLVVRVHVAPGDVVQAGQPLIAIEAMKMENELRAPVAATVTAVHAAVGSPVEKGAALVEFEQED